MVEKRSATYGAGRAPVALRVAPKRSAAAIVLAGAALLLGLGLVPQAAAMGIPATRVDRLTVTYDDGSGQPRTYHLACGHDETAGTAGRESDRADQTGPAGRADQADRSDPRAGLSDREAGQPGRGGDQGRPAAGRDADACAHLDRIGGPVPAVAPGQACSMIYGGPQTATVRGMWRGHRVAEDYRRTNGCEVDRWSRMEPVLPAPRQRIHHAAPLRG